MSNANKTSETRAGFWHTHPLEDLNKSEWEALCDNCGRCCLLKIEDEDTQEIEFTNIACRLFDGVNCNCGQYALRKQMVKDCVVLTPENIERHAYWMPVTCAYRLLFEGNPLFDWHPLISGSQDTVHETGISMRYKTLAEYEIDQDNLELYVIEEIT